MKFLQRIKCLRCPRKADCAFMDALLRQYDEWWKINKPLHEAALKSAEDLIQRMKNEPS